MSCHRVSPAPDPLEAVLADLEAILPPVVWTADAKQWAVIGLSAKTVQNLVSRGIGPSSIVRMGRRTGFRRSDFLRWLRARLSVSTPAQARALEHQRRGKPR